MGHSHFQPTTVGREGWAVGGQRVDERLGEIAAVNRGGQIADAGVGDGGHGHRWKGGGWRR